MLPDVLVRDGVIYVGVFVIYATLWLITKRASYIRVNVLKDIIYGPT